MPHSVSLSIETNHTFDLNLDPDYDGAAYGGLSDETGASPGTGRSPVSPLEAAEGGVDCEPERPMTSKLQSSSAYGVALTSQTSTRDERSELPSQRNSLISARRKSAPSAHSYADVMAYGGPVVQEGPIPKRDTLKDNRRSVALSEDSRRRSQLFDQAGSAKEKVQRQSPIVTELKTNVIIKDEFTLVTDLSQHLAQRYQRQLSSIMIKVEHSACLALGGNFEPCYILNIQAVPSQMGALTNKRNAAMIQSFMTDILSVPPERGIVTFVPIYEENLAHNGRTVFSEMEKAERNEVKHIAQSTRNSLVFGKNEVPVVSAQPKPNGILVNGSESSKSVTPEPQILSNGNGATNLRDQASSANSRNGRPSTAHGTSSSHGTLDGLRMNPVDSFASDPRTTPKGRPMTLGAEPVSIQEQLKREALQHPSRTSSTQSVPVNTRASSPVNATKTAKEPKKSNLVNSSTKYSTPTSAQTVLAPRPVHNLAKSTPSSVTAPISSPGANRPKHQPLISERRQKNTYLDGVSYLTSKGAAEPSSPTIVVTPSDEAPLKANTAKRRSTITATPKLPFHAPPPAEPLETKSMSSRLSKRKSFMRMFKRTSVPAWYEQ